MLPKAPRDLTFLLSEVFLCRVLVIGSCLNHRPKIFNFIVHTSNFLFPFGFLVHGSWSWLFALLCSVVNKALHTMQSCASMWVLLWVNLCCAASAVTVAIGQFIDSAEPTQIAIAGHQFRSNHPLPSSNKSDADSGFPWRGLLGARALFWQSRELYNFLFQYAHQTTLLMIPLGFWIWWGSCMIRHYGGCTCICYVILCLPAAMMCFWVNLRRLSLTQFLRAVQHRGFWICARSVADYLIIFHTAAAEAEWSDQALQGIFLQPNRKLLLICPLDTLNTW